MDSRRCRDWIACSKAYFNKTSIRRQGGSSSGSVWWPESFLMAQSLSQDFRYLLRDAANSQGFRIIAVEAMRVYV